MSVVLVLHSSGISVRLSVVLCIFPQRVWHCFLRNAADLSSCPSLSLFVVPLPRTRLSYMASRVHTISHCADTLFYMALLRGVILNLTGRSQVDYALGDTAGRVNHQRALAREQGRRAFWHVKWAHNKVHTPCICISR